MPNPDNAIFLCYRRDDANPAAYGIYERLKVAFGERGVFLDHYGFRGGEDWRVKTRPVLEQARAVVVIINKDWITIGKTRFRDADDPVRQELELSLARDDLLVIPVTIDRTPAPGKSDVEAFRQACGDGLANLLAGFFAKTMLKVRFDRDFEPERGDLWDCGVAVASRFASRGTGTRGFGGGPLCSCSTMLTPWRNR